MELPDNGTGAFVSTLVKGAKTGHSLQMQTLNRKFENGGIPTDLRYLSCSHPAASLKNRLEANKVSGISCEVS